MEPQVVTDPEASPKLSAGKRIAFSLVLLLILAAIVEVSASVYLRAAKGYDGEHLLQYSFDSYKNILPTPGYTDTRGVRHNAAGFRRDGEVALAKPEGTYRIFLMGGSTAFGTGGLWSHIEPNYPVLDNDSTIDRYLERYLAVAYPDLKFEVINAAIPSTWTHHSFIYLNQSILRYSPDMVLFLDGFNDFYHCTDYHDQFASYAYGERATVIMGEPSIMALVQANGWWIARKSAAAHLAFRTAQAIGAAVNKPRDRAPLDVEKCFTTLRRVFPANALTMWRRSAVLLAHEGVQSVFMLQPLLVLDRDRKGLTPVERELYDFNVASWLPGHDEFMRRAAPWVSDTARRTLTPLGGRYLDLTGIYRDVEGQIYTDYAHLTPQGNAILARVVADSIMPMVRPAATLPSAAPPRRP